MSDLDGASPEHQVPEGVDAATVDAIGRWTFQIVEEYDDGYWSLYRELEAAVRADLAAGRRHLREAGLEEGQRTPGMPGHGARPD